MKGVKKIISLSHITLIFLIAVKEVFALSLGSNFSPVSTTTDFTVPVGSGSGPEAQESFIGNSWTQQELPPYNELISKSIEELVGIYLGLNTPQVEDTVIQKWIDTNVNTWQVSEPIQKKEEQPDFYIELPQLAYA